MLILLVGSVNCSKLKQHEPDHITYKHSVGCESFFQIIEPTNADIVSRAVNGAKLANSIVFSWCDGKRSSIEEALKRDFKQSIDLSKASKKERDDILGQNRLEEHIEYCREENIEHRSLLDYQSSDTSGLLLSILRLWPSISCVPRQETRQEKLTKSVTRFPETGSRNRPTWGSAEDCERLRRSVDGRVKIE
jgi:hypothetical protein